MGEGIFAVVPSSLIETGKASLFLPTSDTSASESNISCHNISDTLTLVADTSLWPEGCPCHVIEPMLVDCLNSEKDAVYISSVADRLYIAVMKSNCLMMANRFSSQCDEDTLYHTLAAYRTFNLDRLSVPLFVYGDTNISYLKKFIAKCV